jgi:hypothetical protein
LSRKLSVRLAGLINQCVQAAGIWAFLRAGFAGLFRGSAIMAKAVQFSLGSRRPRLTQQVAQAYLDDLAATARDGGHSLPLERLSGFARRNGSSEVNMTLTELFTPEATNLLTVLDPRFHPELGTLAIRIVPAKHLEDVATYDLVHVGPHASSGQSASDADAGEVISASPWERETMTKENWIDLLKSLTKQKGKLDPPPRENPRDRESYLSLREIVLTEPIARKAFLATAWKGRPSGLILLGQLLSKGRWVPEVDTDADYLEAELDHLDGAQPDHPHKEGEWDLGHGWTVTREIVVGGERTYRAAGRSGD